MFKCHNEFFEFNLSTVKYLYLENPRKQKLRNQRVRQIGGKIALFDRGFELTRGSRNRSRFSTVLRTTLKTAALENINKIFRRQDHLFRFGVRSTSTLLIKEWY